MKYPHISSVGQYLICTFYFSTLSVIKTNKYSAPGLSYLHSFHKLISRRISLLLSWYSMLLSILYPWHSINNTVHKIYTDASSTATDSSYVLILVFSFCLLKTDCIASCHIVIIAPVWLFKSGWTEKLASTYHLITFKSS